MDDPDGPPAMLVLVVGGRTLPLGALDTGGPVDLQVVDQLLRLRLTARRRGASLWPVQVRPDLRELLELVGVTQALGLAAPPDDATGGPIRARQPSMRPGNPNRSNSSG